MIVIFGELNLDIFYSFKEIVNSPTLQSNNPQIPIEIHPGGKGANHAVAVVKAGGEAIMVGAVGNDQAGELLKKALKEYGVDVSYIAQTDSMHTASVMISKEKGFFGSTILSGNNANLMNNLTVLEKLGLNKDDILITHFAPNLDEVIKAINYADQKGAKVILNPSPLSDFPTDILSKIDLVIVNEDEAKGVAKLLEYPWSNYEQFAYDIGNRFHNNWIVTLGKDGSIAYYDHELWRIMAREVEVIDTIGAGDTFLGYIAASISKGESFAHAYKLANIASSLTCTKVGAQNAMPYLEEVMEHYDSSSEPINLIYSPFNDECEVMGTDTSFFKAI